MHFAKDAEEHISKEAIAKSTVVTGNVRQFATVENPADIITKKRLKIKMDAVLLYVKTYTDSKNNPPAQLVMSYASGLLYTHSFDEIRYSKGYAL